VNVSQIDDNVINVACYSQCSALTLLVLYINRPTGTSMLASYFLYDTHNSVTP